MEKKTKVWESFTNQKQWKEYIQNLIKTNDVALYRGILILYDFQVEEERKSKKALVENGKGFSRIDATFLSEMAYKIMNKYPLTEGELAKSRNKMVKYWKQLMIVSKKKMEKEQQIEDDF